MHIVEINVFTINDVCYTLVQELERRPNAKKKSRRELKRIRGSVFLNDFYT